MLKTINDSEKLSDFLKKFQELDKKIFDFEKLTYDLDSRFPMFRNYTDENIANVYKIYETLKTEILNVAAVILQKNDETLNVNNLTKLYQFFNMVSSADDQQTSKTQKLKMSSKLDKSFQTFWRNRQSRLQSFKVNNKNGMYDDNWLKRMSKMPKFDIPEKFNSFNTGINAIGIDLGTSSCCVAVNRENRIEAVAIDITGERTLPSFVGYDEKDVKCGKVVVGNLGMYSKSTIFDTKRVIGKTYAEVEIDPMWLFNVVEDGESVKLEVQGYMNTILRQTPEEVTSELLNYMKQKAEEFQKKAVDNVVITIPASFTDNQKEATLKAAELAGLIHVHLLPEPVAASITYFIDRSE
uniref:Heat shock protein 70 n=1 Tax=Panagrolaimus davidi TaxID=227884 RepID=A0A914PJQ6_9BILA